VSVEAENRSTIEALWRAWNEERLDEVIAMYVPHARLRHFAHGIDVTGTKSIRDLMEMSLATVPGRRSEVSYVFAAGDHVVTENRFHGTLADSHEPFTNNMCYVFRLADGKIVEQREYG